MMAGLDRKAGKRSAFSIFLADIEHARACFMRDTMKQINKVSARDWRAAAWLLGTLFS